MTQRRGEPAPRARWRAGDHDWSRTAAAPSTTRVQFHDETLRDGIQGPSITDPPLGAKIEMLERVAALGVHSIDLGLPGAGPRALADATALARHMARHRLPIQPQCAARTHPADIRAIVEVSQRTGLAVEVATFVGTSPIRQLVEDWDIDQIRRWAAGAIELAVAEGLPVSFVTEDTTRSRPEVLEVLYRDAIEGGARRIALCDTVGAATPHGARALVEWIRGVVDGTGEAVAIDWHGHNDRGLALANSISAAAAGADRLHGTALGIGERVGNTALDQLLVHYQLAGVDGLDLSGLSGWCRLVSRACDWPIAAGYPLRDAPPVRAGGDREGSTGC